MNRGGGLLLRIAAAIAIALTLPTAAQAELPVRTLDGGNPGEITQLTGDRIVHSKSGFVFPSKLGDIPAGEVVVYGLGDVSVDYNADGHFNKGGWLTFYVYPARGELGMSADIVEMIIREQWAGEPASGAPAMPSAVSDGRSGWFDAKREGKEFLTGYVLVKRGNWYLKARFTVPKESGAEEVDRLVAAVNAVQWTWLPVN